MLSEVDLDSGEGVAEVRRQATWAYEAMAGARCTDLPMAFLTGIENTLMWVATGSGFAGVVDRHWLRQHWGWDV